jgi:hypothetical protein
LDLTSFSWLVVSFSRFFASVLPKERNRNFKMIGRKDDPAPHLDRPPATGADWLALLNAAPESVGIDPPAVRRYRLGRVRSEMKKAGVAALILSDPVNIRYATGARNLQVSAPATRPRAIFCSPSTDPFCMNSPDANTWPGASKRWMTCVRPKPPAMLRPGRTLPRGTEKGGPGNGGPVAGSCGETPVVGLERMNAGVALEMARMGVRGVDAQEPVELARSIKSDEEIKCVTASLHATESGKCTPPPTSRFNTTSTS